MGILTYIDDSRNLLEARCYSYPIHPGGGRPLGSSDDFTVGSPPLQEGTPLVAIAIDTALAKRASTPHSFTLAGCLSGCLWGHGRDLERLIPKYIIPAQMHFVGLSETP
jgi:hypothetical protein